MKKLDTFLTHDNLNSSVKTLFLMKSKMREPIHTTKSIALHVCPFSLRTAVACSAPNPTLQAKKYMDALCLAGVARAVSGAATCEAEARIILR